MNTHKKFRRASSYAALVGLLSALIMQPADAATDLSDAPINVMNAVSPNIMFTLDDSGSMQFEASPEFQLADAQVPNYPTIWQVAGIQYLFPPRNSNTYNDTGDLYRSWIWSGGQWYFEYLIPDFNINNPVARYARSAAGNPMYYNPNIRYLPWRRSDGTFYPNSNPSSAPLHPTRSVAGNVNLTGTLSLSGFFVSTSSSGGYQNYLSTNFSFKPATYFRYLGTGRLSGFADPNNTAGNFQRVEITSGSTYPKSAERTDCAGSVCTYAEEIQNFANWFTYYRSRGLAARAGIGSAFSSQNENIRVGFGQINTGTSTVDGVSTGTIELGVRKFAGTDRDAFFNRLYNAQIPTLSTPLRRAADDVGQYFMRADDAGPYGEFPGTGGGTQFSCRPNFHVLMSDGYWSGDTANEARTALARANTDGSAGQSITSSDNLTVYQYAPATPYSDSFENTLADVAMYYWKNDLRTDATMKNDVKPRDTDPAFWQHVSMYNIGLGVTGSVSSDLIDQALAGDPTTINWPNPANGNPEKLDDFAHAAINSRGGFFSAAEPDVFADELTRTLDAIVAQTSAAAAVSVTDVNLASSALNLIFSTEYESGGWTGDLFVNKIDPANGNILPDVVWPAGSAGPQLTQRTPDSRYIVTYDPARGTGVQFQPVGASTSSTVSATQQASLDTSATNQDGANVINYLRGDRSLEGTVYRTRNSLLGDMINSEPALLNPPEASYSGNDYTGYEAFKSANANRERVIFVGSNDGMVHAFDVATGAELWAYIPSQALDDLNHLTNLGGLNHQYHVDGLITIGDVDFRNTSGASGGTDWRTILVGGLGKGGRGFFALDVTDPTPDTEQEAAGRVLWEFPNASTSALYADKVGYSFGRPIIMKAGGKWVVIVSSGYNNGTQTGGDGHGYLFVLNARTGEVIQAIDTGAGTATNPSGLAQLAAFAYDASIDVSASQIYGGDLLGNVWRFDLSANNSNQWTVSRLAQLKDSSGNPQPVTTTPKLSVIGRASDLKRMVFVGTGQYLGLSDVPGTGTSNSHATQTQTMYGLYDDNSASEIAVRGDLVEQVLTTVDSNGRRSISNTQTVDLNLKRGWFVDLNITGERINTDPAIAFTTLVFNTNIPNSDPCEPGGSSHQFFLDIATGATPPTATYVAEFQMNALLSRPVLFRTTSGTVKAASRATNRDLPITDVPTKPNGGAPQRVSWRELPEVSQ